MKGIGHHEMRGELCHAIDHTDGCTQGHRGELGSDDQLRELWLEQMETFTAAAAMVLWRPVSRRAGG
jgi:hypothetical protein